MRFHNTCEHVITSWKGTDIPPGETVEIDVPDIEAKWLLRHGCADPDAKKAEKPKPARRSFTRKPLDTDGDKD